MSDSNRFIIGVVTNNERTEIEKLYKRKLALESLARLWGNEQKDIHISNETGKRLLDELGEVHFAMEKWWKNIAKKYNWSYDKNYAWAIDFGTNEIMIEKRETI